MSDLKLSPKHGVNPAIPLCFFCNKPKNEVILAGLMPGDQEAPTASVWDKRPCDECRGYMDMGIILISVKSDETDLQNPYRTGGWCVVNETALQAIITSPDLCADILKSRVAFVPDDAWAKMGLPKGEQS